MRQPGFRALFAIVAFMLVIPAQAQENAVVRLEGLPQPASVYVDGKKVTVSHGSITVPAGWHEIQVEGRRPGCRLSLSVG